MIRVLTLQGMWKRELKGRQNTKQVKALGKGWCKGQHCHAQPSRGDGAGQGCPLVVPGLAFPCGILPGAAEGVQIVCQGFPMDWMCSLAFIRKAAMLVLRGSASSKGNLSTKVAPHW